MPARVVAKRQFAGSWEYLLDEAIFTTPPHPAWSGAALIDHSGKLVGVGSLIVNDASGKGDGVAGNMFVPIDRLTPILGDLIADGRASSPPHPWLGLATDQRDTGLVVMRVVPGGPAEKAGLKHGDVIARVAGQSPDGLVDFYRKIWALGGAGVVVPLDVVRGREMRHIDVPSINRLDHLRLKSTF
jgi:S1-C subfamily serine protease